VESGGHNFLVDFIYFYKGTNLSDSSN